MKFRVKYDTELICNNLLREQLDALDLPYEIHGDLEVVLKKETDPMEMKRIALAFSQVGIQILDDEKTELVEQIKEMISQLIYVDTDARRYKLSEYLSEKLNYSYGHLANIFSQTTYTSIKRFIILRKIDYTKTLLYQDNLTLTEIAYRLNYSSVAHLSNQFKKVTGLSPTLFQEIIAKRQIHREHMLNDLL